MSDARNPHGVDIPADVHDDEEDAVEPDPDDPVLIEYEIVDRMFVPKKSK